MEKRQNLKDEVGSKRLPSISAWLAAWMFILCLTLHGTRLASAQSETKQGFPQPAELVNEEGGPVTIRGEANYTFPYFTLFLPRPFIVLYDISGIIVDHDIDFYPSAQSQAFGTISTNPFESPFDYTIELPSRPNGDFRDVDQDGEPDEGVMIFSLMVASNTWGDPFLEARDNFITGILNSATISTDIDSFLQLENGSILVYAEDAGQGFPSGFGDDGILFTNDDPIVTLPAGYTLVRLGDQDEDFVFDRALEPTVALLEAEEAELDDFSDLSYVEAFDAMIDLLKREYAFTEYKSIDWDAIAEQYRPTVVDAEQEEDLATYSSILSEIALSIPDGHVSGPLDYETFQRETSGGLGLALRELDDGHVVVSYVRPEGPADLAGIKLGAEILEIDGVAIHAALEATRMWSSTSTEVTKRLQQLSYVVRFAEGTRVDLQFRNPQDDEVREETLTTIFDVESFGYSGYQSQDGQQTNGELPVEYVMRDDGFAYVKIYSFSDDLPLTVNLWERFISRAVFEGALGVIVDLRENGGGSGYLGDQLPAYFFDRDYVIGNTARYSERQNAYVVNPAEEERFVVPPSGLIYNGPVAVIVSPNCASACESFAFAMTVNDRAIFVGNYPTAGLGGSVVPIAMPDGLSFSYTNSRSLDANGEIAIEGKGVAPTVRVPVTLETLLSDGDPLLDAAIDALRSELNFVEIGEITRGTVAEDRIRYRVELNEGQLFSVEARGLGDEPQPLALRLYAFGQTEPLLEEVGRGGSDGVQINGLRAPANLTLIIEVASADDRTSVEFELEVIDDSE
jgi:C-terminal processing protease CtpA/Prc